MWLFVVFALTWDLMGGQMGYNSFGNVVFVGVGMYACVVTQIGLFYSVGAYTAARGGGGTDFVFTMPQYVGGLAVGLAVGGVWRRLAALVLGSHGARHARALFRHLHPRAWRRRRRMAAGWEWIGAGVGHGGAHRCRPRSAT